MRIDEYGVLVSEIWPDTGDGWAANRGDSMANTARWFHLKWLVDGDSETRVLENFITEKGYVRHPSPQMPDDWKESDIPTDQCLPLFLGFRGHGKFVMLDRIRKAGWRTGNGDLVSPAFYAILTDRAWLLGLALAAQLLIFRLPVRWSDSKRNLELSANSSADVLNFIHALLSTKSIVNKFVDKLWLMEKIQSYFRNEPNSEFLIDFYRRAIWVVLR